jgi:hypothetical protein
MELNLRERTLQQLYKDVKEAEVLFGGAEAKETIYILRKPDGSLRVTDGCDVFTDRALAERACKEWNGYEASADPLIRMGQWTVAEFVAR